MRADVDYKITYEDAHGDQQTVTRAAGQMWQYLEALRNTPGCELVSVKRIAKGGK